MGIPPAPRGVPQIEVTFDIDANGIVHVSAKDLGTGKEQSIKIQVSSGLSETEIKRMVEEARLHEAEDKKRREEIETKNQADTFVYQTEKMLKEYGDKVGEAEKSQIQSKLEALKEALKGGDVAAIKARQEELMTASHKLAEAMYKNTGGDAGAQPGGDTGGYRRHTASGPDATGMGNDDVVDAEFESVDDSKK